MLMPARQDAHRTIRADVRPHPTFARPRKHKKPPQCSRCATKKNWELRTSTNRLATLSTYRQDRAGRIRRKAFYFCRRASRKATPTIKASGTASRGRYSKTMRTVSMIFVIGLLNTRELGFSQIRGNGSRNVI